MKKIKASLITIHTGPNFGTILQVIASVATLQKHNIDTTVVNYIPPRDSYKRIVDDAIRRFKSGSAFGKIRAILGIPKRFNVLYGYNKTYIGVLKKYCKLSGAIYESDDFSKKCPQADYYITGSDQVWNTVHNEGIDTHYFFDKIEGKKIAFSSSIGMDSLNANEREVYAKQLSTYSSISVRETKAVELLSGIGIVSTQLLDPTFMLNREEWYNTLRFQRLQDEPYIVVYAPYNTVDKTAIYNKAREIAKNKKCKIVTFSWNKFDDPDADITFKEASPLDFISLMYYAEYVITNSFHGTAFSINLNKQFLVFMPSQFTSRIESILNLCKLENRIADRVSDFNELIDYSKVNQILDYERKRAHEFLNKALA